MIENAPWIYAGLIALVGFFARRELKRIGDDIAEVRKGVQGFDRRILVLEIQSDRLGRIRATDLEKLELAKGRT